MTVTSDSRGVGVGKRGVRIVFTGQVLVRGQFDDHAPQQLNAPVDRRSVILEPVKFFAELRCEPLLDFAFVQGLQRVLALSSPSATGEKTQGIAADHSNGRRAGLPSQNGIQAQQGGDRWGVLVLPAAGFGEGIDGRAAAARDFGLGQLQLSEPGLNEVDEPVDPFSWSGHISHPTAPNARNLTPHSGPGFLSYPIARVAS